MKHLRKIKFVFVVLIFVGSAWFSIPQIFPEAQMQKAPPWLQPLIYKGRLNLGLDLKGGLYLVLGLDIPRVLEESLQRDAKIAEEGLKKENIPFQESKFTYEGTYYIYKLTFPSQDAKKKADQFFSKSFPNLLVHFEEESVLYLRLLEQEIKDLRDKTINQSIETLRNRIDEFGVKEPLISKSGEDRIQIQFPGLTEAERIKSIIKRTAKLEFRIVSEQLNTAALNTIVSDAKQKGIAFEEKSGLSHSEYTRKLNEFAKSSLPTSTVIRFQHETNSRTQEVTYTPLLVEDTARLTGYHLQDARVGIDPQDQMPMVSLAFNPQGASLLNDISSNNIGKPMAIILDDTINSAPVIRSAIPNGQAQITLGRFSDYSKLMQEASDLVVVLRAGSLPTTLEFLEERTIGPSLGTDSIQAGTKAVIVSGIITFAFILIYYAGSGIIACFALLFNIFLLLTCMLLFGATLTLPGLAGIALTFGMSVDANILIFERIRENLRRGRNVITAVMSGYEKAWVTIFDSNITTVFAGIVLLQYGTGPIKGFAVTLILGLLTSMFTAYFASKTISEWLYDKPGTQKISIGISLPKPGHTTPPLPPPERPPNSPFIHR